MAAKRVRVQKLPSEQKASIRRQLGDYLLELADLEGVEPELDENGLPAYTYFDSYWVEPDRVPLGIYVDDTLAGLCFLRDDGAAWQVAEFYIRPEFRRQRVGTAAVAQIKRTCPSLGRHRELQARVAHWNQPSQAFWLSQEFERKTQDAESTVFTASLL